MLFVYDVRSVNPLTIILPQANLGMRLKAKEEELQLLKQQTEREKKELQRQLEMVTKRDQEHKRQLESVKREMDQNVLAMQEVHTAYV